MTDDPEVDRVARLIGELDELPFEEREAAIAKLSEEDREAVWAAKLEQSESALPENDDELGGEG